MVVREFELLTPCMPCHSVGFRRIRRSSEGPVFQGFQFIRVHYCSLQFKIFADGNADTQPNLQNSQFSNFKRQSEAFLHHQMTKAITPSNVLNLDG